MKQANKWLDALVAALAAKKAHEQALRELIDYHGGKRTLPLMEDLCAGIRILFPKTDAEVTVRGGQPNVSFPSKSSGYETWRRDILPHLPKLKAATTKGPRKSVDPVVAAAKRLKQQFTAAQLRRLVAML